MYEYMLYWRRNDGVNRETESKYYLSQPVDPVICLDCGGPYLSFCLCLINRSFDSCLTGVLTSVLADPVLAIAFTRGLEESS